MIWIVVAIAFHAIVLVIMEYFRSTQIDIGGPYSVSGITFKKKPGYWKYEIRKQYTHIWGKRPKLGPGFQTGGTVLGPATVTRKGVTLGPGYAWDGSSGPAKDTWSGMRASALHDVWCQAMARRVYARGFHNWRLGAREYRKTCIVDHMPKWRAWLRYVFVHAYGRFKYRHN